MKTPPFGLFRIQSHRVEESVEPWLAAVEMVRKMITKSGKFWGIYSKLQVTVEWMIVNLHILLEFDPVAYSCKLQVTPTFPRFAVCWSNDVCLFVCRDTLKWTTADISSLIDIIRKLFDRKDVWRCLSQHLAGILQITDANYISTNHSCWGAIARSEWTRCIRAVRDSPVGEYSTAGIDNTRRVACRPAITVSPFLLALLVSYCKQRLYRCGQLWPYVGMGSLGTRLHWDCNGMGDAAKISPRVPSTCSSRRIGWWEDMILPGSENPPDCVDPRNLGKSEWDQKLGMIECVFLLYDKMI